MIKPTIGRVVLGHRENSGSDQPEPALVCHVWGDRCINVGGFDKDGKPFSATSVCLLQDDEQPEGRSIYAEWMPHQKAQAEKVSDE
jgi:hypothetical protein